LVTTGANTTGIAAVLKYSVLLIVVVLSVVGSLVLCTAGDRSSACVALPHRACTPQCPAPPPPAADNAASLRPNAEKNGSSMDPFGHK
jgi:hypothetical protein